MKHDNPIIPATLYPPVDGNECSCPIYIINDSYLFAS